MAGAIRGITVEINGDVTRLTTAMRNAAQEASATEKELKAVERALRNVDPNNAVLLAQKQELLNKAVTETTAKLEALRAMHAQVSATMGPMTEAEAAQFRRLTREIELTEAALHRAQAAQMAFASGATQMTALGNAWRTQGAAIVETTAALNKLSLAVAAVVGLTAKASIEFESSFAGVRKTVDATEEEFDQLADAARRMALTKPIDVNDVNRIMELGGQLGIARDSLESFADVVSDLDVATDLGVEEAATDLAQFANSTQMAQADFDRFGATLVALGNNSAATESQIAEFAMRLSGAAASAGFTQAQILGISAAMASVGLNAEAGGSAMSKLIQQIDKDVALGTEQMRLWAQTAGMSAQQFAEAWKNDPSAALTALIGGMTKVSDEGGSLAVVMEELGITELRQTDTVKRLANAHDLLGSTIGLANTAWSENSALTDEASRRYATTESQLQIMKNRIMDAAISIGDNLKPALVGLLDAAAGVVEGIARMAAGFAEMSPAAQTTVVAITGLVAGIGPMLTISGKLTSAFGSMVAGIGRVSAAVAAQTVAMRAGTAATLASEAATARATITAGLQGLKANILAAAEAKRAAALGASTAATVASNAAMTAGNAAPTAGTAATVASTVARTASNAATVAGTAAQLALNAAMRANPVGVILTAVLALGAALMGLVNAYKEATDWTGDLTSASEESAKAVEDASKAYDEAVAKHGEMSDEAAKAKAALEEENEAFERSKQTLGEFVEETDGLLSSHRQLADSIRSANNDAQTQAGTMLNIIDRIRTLSEVENKSADDKTRLAALVDQLNASCEGLNLTYDQQADSLSMTADALEKVVRAEADRLRADAAMSRYNDLVSEQIELEDQLGQSYAELGAQLEVYNSGQTGGVIGSIKWAKACEELLDRHEQLKEALIENKEQQTRALEVYAEATQRTDALSKATEAVRSGHMSAALAANLYSEGLKTALTAEEIQAQLALEAAQAYAEETAELSELTDKVALLVVNVPGLSQAMHDAGVSTGDLAQMLHDAGISADEFEQDVQSLVEVTTNGFSEMKQATDISLDDYIANLQQRQEATRNWSQNLQQLYAEAGSESERAFIEYLQQLGPEYSAFVQQIIDENRMPEVAAQWAEGGTAAGESYITNLSGQVSGGQPQVDAAVAANVQTMQASVEPASQAGTQGGTQFSSGMAQGVASGNGAVYGAAQGLAQATEAANQNNGAAWGWGNDLGNQLANGLYAATSFVSGAASNIAGIIRSFLHFSVPDRGPLADADEYMPDFVELMAEGMHDTAPKLVQQASMLAKSTSEAMKFDYSLNDATEYGSYNKAMQVTAPDPLDTSIQRLIDALDGVEFVGVDVDVAEMVVREEADVRKVSSQLAQMVTRRKGATVGQTANSNF